MINSSILLFLTPSSDQVKFSNDLFNKFFKYWGKRCRYDKNNHKPNNKLNSKNKQKNKLNNLNLSVFLLLIGYNILKDLQLGLFDKLYMGIIKKNSKI